MIFMAADEMCWLLHINARVNGKRDRVKWFAHRVWELVARAVKCLGGCCKERKLDLEGIREGPVMSFITTSRVRAGAGIIYYRNRQTQLHLRKCNSHAGGCKWTAVSRCDAVVMILHLVENQQLLYNGYGGYKSFWIFSRKQQRGDAEFLSL